MSASERLAAAESPAMEVRYLSARPAGVTCLPDPYDGIYMMQGCQKVSEWEPVERMQYTQDRNWDSKLRL